MDVREALFRLRTWAERVLDWMYGEPGSWFLHGAQAVVIFLLVWSRREPYSPIEAGVLVSLSIFAHRELGNVLEAWRNNELDYAKVRDGVGDFFTGPVLMVSYTVLAIVFITQVI